MTEFWLTINPIACDGRGLCAEVAPELIRLDDWGFPIIRPGPVPPELVPHAEAAVRLCPLLALAAGRSAARTRDLRSAEAGIKDPACANLTRASSARGC